MISILRNDLYRLFALTGVTILFLYYLPGFFSILYFLLIWIIYWRSKDEPFWLAFFLILSDGFLGFFGLYEASIGILPGLPEIEAVQIYIILVLVKSIARKQGYPLFYGKILILLGIYLVFLIIFGMTIGITGLNVYFRVIKVTLPFILFFVVPKLLRTENDFQRFFSFLFPVLILAFASQLFEIITGGTIISFLGAKETVNIDITKETVYRGFYNVQIVIIGFFAALFYQAVSKKVFNPILLNATILSGIFMVFLSATRGWFIGFGVISVFYYLFIQRIKPLKVLLFFLLFSGIVFISSNIPVLRVQVRNSIERIVTVGGFVEGEKEVVDAEQRIGIRSPRVLAKWRESPLFGWGFSNVYFKHGDGHVGNQNILLHSGIIGALLLFYFFLFFNIKLLLAASGSINKGRKELFVIPLFFLGWFIIHSTSGQHFGFANLPAAVIIQSVFFSFGSLQYIKMTKKHVYIS